MEAADRNMCTKYPVLNGGNRAASAGKLIQ